MRPSSRALIGVGVFLLCLQTLTFAAVRAGAVDTQRRPDVRLRINPNLASRETLMLLPNIGPALADAVIEYRESQAPRRAFRSHDDIERVHGLGPVAVERLAPHLKFDDPSERSPR